MNCFLMPQIFVLHNVLKKGVDFTHWPSGVRILCTNELRLRQSADVIAHCPRASIISYFESESNDSYVCMLCLLNQLAFANIRNILKYAYTGFKISHIVYILYLKRKILSDAICHFCAWTLPLNAKVKYKSTMNYAPRTALSSTFIPRIRSDLCVMRSRSP